MSHEILFCITTAIRSFNDNFYKYVTFTGILKQLLIKKCYWMSYWYWFRDF